MDTDNSIFDNLEDLVESKTYYQNNDFFFNLNEINHDDPTFIHMNLLKRHSYNKSIQEEIIKKDKIINDLIFMRNQTLNLAIFWKKNFDSLFLEYKNYYLSKQVINSNNSSVNP